MTEDEYVIVTDLTRVRAALYILGNCTSEQELITKNIIELKALEMTLNSKIKLDEEPIEVGQPLDFRLPWPRCPKCGSDHVVQQINIQRCEDCTWEYDLTAQYKSGAKQDPTAYFGKP